MKRENQEKILVDQKKLVKIVDRWKKVDKKLWSVKNISKLAKI